MSSIPGCGIGVRGENPSHAICGNVRQNTFLQIGLVAKRINTKFWNIDLKSTMTSLF